MELSLDGYDYSPLYFGLRCHEGGSKRRVIISYDIIPPPLLWHRMCVMRAVVKGECLYPRI